MNFNLQAAFSFTATSQSSNSVQSPNHGRHGDHRHGHKPSAPTAETPAASQAPRADSVEEAVSPAVVPGEKQSAAKTAANILSHVQSGLDALKASGASQEQIDARLEAAKAGIATGYAEAREMLEGMGMLDDDLAADIDRGEIMVNEGIKSLAAGETPALLSNDDMEEEDAPEQMLTTMPVYKETSATRTSNQMSLEVVTQDGDRVTIDFSRRQGSLEMNSGNLSVSASAFTEKWEMEVNGYLDDDEKAALESLFSDVQKLSETFFNGDLGAALEEAMSLGFDGNELASMSLNLRQQSFSSVSRAYAQAGPSMPTERLESQRNHIADYVDSYMKAIDKASPVLSNPLSNLQEMLAKLVPEDDRIAALASFNEGLNRLV